MDNSSTLEFKQALQEQLDNELDNKETFPPKIQEQIKEVYKNLWEQRIAWLKERQEKEELP